ncbi:MAG: type II secretion system F family protein [Nanoarchaeota archaeon]
MANLKNINKEGLGKVVMPDKIYKLKYKEELEKLYEKLYFNNLNYYAIANIFALSVIVTFTLFLLIYPILYQSFNDVFAQTGVMKFIVFFVTYFVLNLVVYYLFLFMFFFVHDSKFKKAENAIEKDLPEFLDNLISNLKGGISLEKALLKSVRPEQKALAHEVTLINEKILMGMAVTEALDEFRKRYDSPIINRTLFLIDEGIKGGGDLAKPLERISENLKRIYILEEEMRGNAGGFAIIIRAISLLVAPLLFALAITLLTFIGNLFGILAESGNEMLTFGTIPPEFTTYLMYFSYSMIGLITVFSSLITSQLKNEKTYTAVKYLPFYVAIALILFNVFSKVLLGFFGGIIG